MRERALRAVAAGMREREAALCSRGMVLGEDERIDDETRDDWRAAGLAHLLAVSGQNVMLLAALALPLLRSARVGLRARVSRPRADRRLRAARRRGTVAAARRRHGRWPGRSLASSRPASRSYALLLAAAATLGLNPRACGDPGWQLSFAAVAGILVVGMPLAGLRRGRRLRGGASPRALADGVAITVAATLATAPLVAHHFGTVSLAALPANLLALPAVAPAMWLGMVKTAPRPARRRARAGCGARAGASALGAVAELPLRVPRERSPSARGNARRPAARAAPSRRSSWAPTPPSRPGVLAAERAAAAAARCAEAACAGARCRGPSAARPRRGAAALVAAARRLARAARPARPSHGPLPRRRPGRRDADPATPTAPPCCSTAARPRHGVARLLRRAGVGRLSARRRHPPVARPPRRPAEVVRRFPVDLLLDGGDGTTDPTFRGCSTRRSTAAASGACRRRAGRR